MAKAFKHEFKKNFLKDVKIEKQFNKLADAAERKKIMKRDEIPNKKIYLVRFKRSRRLYSATNSRSEGVQYIALFR